MVFSHMETHKSYPDQQAAGQSCPTAVVCRLGDSALGNAVTLLGSRHRPGSLLGKHRTRTSSASAQGASQPLPSRSVSRALQHPGFRCLSSGSENPQEKWPLGPCLCPEQQGIGGPPQGASACFRLGVAQFLLFTEILLFIGTSYSMYP